MLSHGDVFIFFIISSGRIGSNWRGQALLFAKTLLAVGLPRLALDNDAVAVTTWGSNM